MPSKIIFLNFKKVNIAILYSILLYLKRLTAVGFTLKIQNRRNILPRQAKQWSCCPEIVMTTLFLWLHALCRLAERSDWYARKTTFTPNCASVTKPIWTICTI